MSAQHERFEVIPALDVLQGRCVRLREGNAKEITVDVRDGRVAAEGWTQTSTLPPAELARRCMAAGVARLIVTATRRDGTLAGPDLALLDEVMAAAQIPVVGSGGVASLDDLRRLRE